MKDYVIGILAFIVASLFVLSDNTTQFMMACAKDFSFTIALMWLLFLAIFGWERCVESPIRSTLVIVASALVLALGASRYMPDSFDATNAMLSRDGRYILEFSWIMIVCLSTWVLIRRGSESKTIASAMALSAVMMMASAHIIVKEQSVDASEFGKSIPIVVEGLFVGQEWVTSHVDYHEFVNTLRQLESGVTAVEMKTLENTLMEVELRVGDQGVFLRHRTINREDVYPLTLRNVFGNLLIFISWFAVIFFWPLRSRTQALMSKYNVR